METIASGDSNSGIPDVEIRPGDRLTIDLPIDVSGWASWIEQAIGALGIGRVSVGAYQIVIEIGA